MKQRVIWIICLIIGSSIILNSCKKWVEYHFKTTYVYLNDSDHEIELFVFNKSDRVLIREIPIQTGDSASIVLYSDGSPAPPFFFNTFLHSIGDSVSVIFDKTRFLYYTKDKYTNRSILDYRNYEGGKVSKTVYSFRYRFTNEDYDRAIGLK